MVCRSRRWRVNADVKVAFFARVSPFRRNAPHQWLMKRRIEVAKEKLRDGRLSLTDVATAPGFGDQSHLTRASTHTVGVSPGAWRRALMQ